MKNYKTKNESYIMINPQCHDLMEIVTINNDSGVFEQRLSRLSLYQAYLYENHVFVFFRLSDYFIRS
jgi:hypothetical protein